MKACVVVTARPSWAKLRTICLALRADPTIELQLVVCASALLERYGCVRNVIASEFEITAECWSTLEGATLETSAKETGILLEGLSAIFKRLAPDVVVVCADRHEVLAAAQASSYLHIKTLHIQGGESTGSIDNKVRDAITHLSDYHCVATECAKFRVYGLTGQMDRIWNTGCPSIDLAKQALREPPVTVEELGGAGAPIDLKQPFAIVLQHPVTNEPDAAEQMAITLQAFGPQWLGHQLQVLALWPGEDAGAEASSKVLRGYQDRVHTVRSLPPSRFLRLLTQAAVLVGNSSAGIREASYLGVPVVNIGSRQHGRERGRNVRDVPHDPYEISRAMCFQRRHGPYPSADLYGTGDAGQQIASVIRGL